MVKFCPDKQPTDYRVQVGEMTRSTIYAFLRRINEACFKRHPLLTNVALSCCLVGTSDFIAQKYVQGHQTLDIQRTQHMVTYGCTTAPLWHLWYNTVDRYIKPSKVWLKVILDQTTVAPLNYIGFFAVFNYFKGDTVEECISELKRVYFKALIPDMVFWPFVTFVGYKWIPLRYRFFYFEFLGMVWDTFLSYLKYSGKHQVKQTEITSELVELDNNINTYPISHVVIPQSIGERKNNLIYQNSYDLDLSNFISDVE